MLRALLNWFRGTPPAPVGVVLRYDNGNSEPLDPTYVGRDEHGNAVWEAVIRRPALARRGTLHVDTLPAGATLRVRPLGALVSSTPDERRAVQF